MKITDWLTVAGTVFTGVAALSALYVYWKNSRLERAKWLASLYEKFYEKDHLKHVRQILDCEDDISLEIARLIRDESADFTD